MANPIVAAAPKIATVNKLIAPSTVRYTLNQSMAIQPGQQTQVNLKTGNIIRAMFMELQYSIIVGTTAMPASSILAGDEFSLINQFLLQTNDNDVIINASGIELMAARGQLNKHLVRKNAQLLAGVSASTTVVIDKTLVIPFWMLDTLHGVDSALDTRTMDPNGLQLSINWNTVSSLTSVAGVTLGGALKCNIWTMESFGGFTPILDLRVDKIPLPSLTSGSTGNEIALPIASNLEYRGFIIHQQAGSTLVDTPGVLTNFTVKNGQTDIVNINPVPWNEARNQMSGEVQSVTDAETGFVSPASDIEAWVFVDLVADGYLTEAISAKGLSSLTLKYDVAAGLTNPQVTVYPVKIFTPAA